MTDPQLPADAATNAVEHLVAANEESNATMRRLVERVREDADMREKKIDLLELGLVRTKRLIIMVGAVLIIMVSIGVTNAINLNDARRNAAATAAAARDAKATYAILYDCLNQQGECGRQNAAESKRLLDEVKLYELTVLYCVRINPQIADPQGDDFLDCVKRLYPTGPELPKRS